MVTWIVYNQKYVGQEDDYLEKVRTRYRQSCHYLVCHINCLSTFIVGLVAQFRPVLDLIGNLHEAYFNIALKLYTRESFAQTTKYYL